MLRRRLLRKRDRSRRHTNPNSAHVTGQVLMRRLASRVRTRPEAQSLVSGGPIRYASMFDAGLIADARSEPGDRQHLAIRKRGAAVHDDVGWHSISGVIHDQRGKLLRNAKSHISRRPFNVKLALLSFGGTRTQPRERAGTDGTGSVLSPAASCLTSTSSKTS